MSTRIPDSTPIPGEAADAPRRRRAWWQFSLRTMLFLVVLAGVGAAWLADRQRLLARLDRAEQELAYYTKVRNSWGAEQATGPPDTQGWGDLTTAWASATEDDQREWLDLRYNQAVRPVAVVIHETYNPGAVDRVAVIDSAGKEHIVWQGRDPTPATAPGGVSRIPVRGNYKIDRIKVYINSPAVPGWNEIDAVGLVEADGSIHWARFCTASTTFGASAPPTQFLQPMPASGVGGAAGYAPLGAPPAVQGEE